MTRVTCHVTIVTSKKMANDKDADAFMLLYFLTAKQHKKRTMWVRRWLLDRQSICWSYISSADCLWKLNHALEVGRLYRSSDASFINFHSFWGKQNKPQSIEFRQQGLRCHKIWPQWCFIIILIRAYTTQHKAPTYFYLYSLKANSNSRNIKITLHALTGLYIVLLTSESTQ